MDTVPNFLIQGGDITHNDGTGGESIYGTYFPDEIPNYASHETPLRHNRPYFVTMSNKNRPNSQSSQFFINTVKTQWLDGSSGRYSMASGQNVIIGMVVEGQAIVDIIERQGTDSGVPKRRVVIVDSGELLEDQDVLDSFRIIKRAREA